MLKWLGGGGNSVAGSNGGSGADMNLTHVGKVFNVNEYQVVVEELIAEGIIPCVVHASEVLGSEYGF